MNAYRFTKNIIYIVLLFCIFATACSRTKEISSSSVFTSQPEESAVEHQASLPVKTELEKADIPPPDIGEKDFFKIQVLATQTYDRAQEEKKRLREYTEKTIFLVLEKNLWKVQIGDFPAREEAEKERDLLQGLGWIDAWLIWYRSSIKPEKTQDQTTLDTLTFYTVQLIATTNKTEAENMLKNLTLLDITDAALVKERDFWKIQVGHFSDYSEAVKMLNQVKKMGFDDSWITQRSKRLPDINNNFIQPASLSKNITLFEIKEFSSNSSGVKNNSLTVII